MIELRGGLIVLRGPVLAAVDGDGGAAIVAVDKATGIFGIDPERMVVAVRSVEAPESLAGID